MEFPIDVNINPKRTDWERAFEALSQAAPYPRTILSAVVNFKMSTRLLAIACRNGESGYLNGRTEWKEGLSLLLPERYLVKEVAVRRRDTIANIAAKYSLPLSDFFPDIENKESPDWCCSYNES